MNTKERKKVEKELNDFIEPCLEKAGCSVSPAWVEVFVDNILKIFNNKIK